MFGFFRKKSLLQKQRKSIESLLYAVRKVMAYRRDCLPEQGLRELRESEETLQALLKKTDAAEEEILSCRREIQNRARKYGGDVYPQGFWTENAEVFLVAAIVALSIRCFFFQPFKIPTNSMYPSYAGMTFEVFSKNNPAPKSWRRVFRFLCLGAVRYGARCPVRGPVFLPLMMRDDHPKPYGGVLNYQVVDGRKYFGLLPTKLRSYRFYVRDTPVDVQVPLEFSLDEVVLKAFYPDKNSWSQVFQGDLRPFIVRKGRKTYLSTSIRKKKDEPLLCFDILSGDMLFVNRLRYHFTRPQIGDPFVFRTRNIPELMGSDKYYIKRLVGQGGDKLEVQEPQLLRNGKALDNCSAFRKNHAQLAPYRGYTASGSLVKGNDVRVPEDHFFAMGDNSPYSGDSRYWGSVPQKEVVGRASFIFYPFTSRWGLAR
ncbi:MAG: signal peptidase I [Puniceicoccales bacterium]|jgi:signal peptidase I|nr:signal peptidase I [Puniceicoccales bacterium]